MYENGEKYKSFSCLFDKLLSHISNGKQLDTHVLFYDEISNCVEKADIRLSLMRHYTKTGLEKLKETLKLLIALIN